MHTVQHLLLQIGDGNWQDVTLSAGNIFFCITLIPMLRQPERPPLLTCIPTGLALIAGGFVLATLHLWLTALTQTIAGLQWLALGFKASPAARRAQTPAETVSASPEVGLPWTAARSISVSSSDSAESYDLVTSRVGTYPVGGPVRKRICRRARDPHLAGVVLHRPRHRGRLKGV
jgi:hypothetical protein